jgi:hypothetical protein
MGDGKELINYTQAFDKVNFGVNVPTWPKVGTLNLVEVYQGKNKIIC